MIIVDDCAILLTYDGRKIIVLDVNSGEFLWQYRFESYCYGVTPGIDANRDAMLIVVCQTKEDDTKNVLYAFK